jgi:2-dehydropantoate 2-reductase
MGQVPYGICGDGKLAHHLIHYFNLLRIPYRQWSRRGQSTAPIETFAPCSAILIAIKDSAIDSWAREYRAQNPSQKLIHFSGALVTDAAVGMHPLMTFNAGFYELAEYQKIPFICEEGATRFEDVFPSLKNPHFTIKREDKAYYHALCVMGGNFSVILWNKLFEEFKTRLQLPPEAAFPYLERVTRNLESDSRQALTGPLQRKDLETVKKNLESLAGDSFQPIYQAFAQAMGVQL